MFGLEAKSILSGNTTNLLCDSLHVPSFLSHWALVFPCFQIINNSTRALRTLLVLTSSVSQAGLFSRMSDSASLTPTRWGLAQELSSKGFLPTSSFLLKRSSGFGDRHTWAPTWIPLWRVWPWASSLTSLRLHVLPWEQGSNHKTHLLGLLGPNPM